MPALIFQAGRKVEIMKLGELRKIIIYGNYSEAKPKEAIKDQAEYELMKLNAELEHERMSHLEIAKDEAKDERKNLEGYFDMTAYQAARKADPNETERFHKLIHTIFHLCELAGFELVGRITLRDRKSNRIWK